ncbi:MAG: hypothetical protein AAFQ94_02625 [Bacteroidota bacterium]
MNIVLSLIIAVSSIQVSGWEIFADTRYKLEWVEELGADVELPIFSDKLKAMDGKEITLTGHYLPMEMRGKSIILSQMPFSSCFFCGGDVGQESIAEVIFKGKKQQFRPDQLLTIKGKLKLNVDDFDHLALVLEDAVVVRS